MTQDEACDLILWGLYDKEASGVGTGISGLNGFLQAEGCDDHRLVGRAAKYLDDLGFLHHYGGVSGFRYHAGISSKAFRMMEKLPHGTSVMEVLHAPREAPFVAGPTYYGPVFQGDVAGSNVAVASRNAQQNITTGSGLSGVVEALISAIREDRSLPAGVREEAIEDAETLKDQLEREKPNSKVVMAVLGWLSVSAIAAESIQKIREAYSSSLQSLPTDCGMGQQQAGNGV